MSVTYPEPNDMPSNIQQNTNTWFKAKTDTTNKTYEIRSNNSISSNTAFFLECLFDGNTATENPDHDRLLYNPTGAEGNDVLILWFKLPDSIKLEKIRMFNQLKITAFKVYRNPTNSTSGGTEIADITNALGSSSAWKEYTMTDTSTASDEFLIVVSNTGWKSNPPLYLQIREMQFISAALTISPPTVTFPTSPVAVGNATVGVVLGSGATQWQYRLDNGNWISGTGNSFQLPAGTYENNTENIIQVRNGDGTNWSTTINFNSGVLVVGIEFDGTTALAQISGLNTLLQNFTEVDNLEEIFELWNNTTQEIGGTDIWVYYAYEKSDNSIGYNTRLVKFDPDNNTWSDKGANASLTASISSNGLSVYDKVNFSNFYTGLEPFQINISTASLADLKTVYDASSYTTNNLSQVYNIWYDKRDIFNVSINNTTREVDVWIYVLTDQTDVFETRKVKYTITNNNATYAWTIPTDITTSTTATISNTQYTNIPSNSDYILVYFYFDAYTITKQTSIISLKSVYRTYFTENQVLSLVNELWYDKSDLIPEDTIYDTTYNDTNLTADEIDFKLYGIKRDLDSNGFIINSEWTRIDIKYSKQNRTWSIVGNEYNSQTINSGITDNVSNFGAAGFGQIRFNILFDLPGNVVAIKTVYYNTYNITINILNTLWGSGSIANVASYFILFETTSNVYYTTALYDRVINEWSFNNASESYDALLAKNVLYSEFTEAQLEGKVDSIKSVYNAGFTNNSIVNVHNVWYNISTSDNTVVEGKMYHSYNNITDATKLYFGIVDLSYNVAANTDNYSVAVATFESKEYDYNGNNALSADYKELSSYTIDVSFNIDTSSPIMINNNTIKSQFDASYVEINTQESIRNIHQVWLKNETVVGNNMNYTTPIQDMWVYYSYLNSSNIIEYESRDLNYNLQLNIWDLNSNDNIESATIRTTGLENTDLTSYTKIFEDLPVVPIFSVNTAKNTTSIAQLQVECVADNGITEVNPNNIIIENLYYKESEKAEKTVSCIAHISYNPHKIFTLTYDNDTKEYTIPGNRTMEEIQDISSFSVDTTGYTLFYSKPIGVSLIAEGIRFYDNSIQTTSMPPIGTIIIYPTNDAIPSGWAECRGTERRLDLYPEYTDLYNLIGTTYGGVTSVKFNLPDLRWNIPMGNISSTDTNTFALDPYFHANTFTGGNSMITGDQTIHLHNVNTTTIRHTYTRFKNVSNGTGITNMNLWANFGPNSFCTTEKTASNGNTQGTQTHYYPRYTTVRYIIRYSLT